MGVIYHHPFKVIYSTVNSHPVLSTAQGGLIYTDRKVIDIWNAAANDPSSLGEGTTASDHGKKLITRAVLACLVEAGLLERQGDEQDSVTHHHSSNRSSGFCHHRLP